MKDELTPLQFLLAVLILSVVIVAFARLIPGLVAP